MARTKRTVREARTTGSDNTSKKEKNDVRAHPGTRAGPRRSVRLQKKEEAIEGVGDHEFKLTVDFHELLQHAIFDYSLLDAKPRDSATFDDQFLADKLPVTEIKAGDIVFYGILDMFGTRTGGECRFVVSCIPYEDLVSFVYFDVHESHVIRMRDLIIVLCISLNKKSHFLLVKWIRVIR